MDTINISDDFATLFVNHNNTLSQKAEAYVKIQHKFVNVIDVTKHHITTLQIIEIANKCNTPLSELFDRTSDFYQEMVKHTSSFAEQDLARMLADNPLLMRTPFVVKGNTLKFFETAGDLA
jgi:arsenate reductase-like glutaredoxin family protein